MTLMDLSHTNQEDVNKSASLDLVIVTGKKKMKILYIFLFLISVAAVFVGSMFVYIAQTTDILATRDQLSQCSKYSAIYAFPNISRNVEYPIDFYDQSTNRYSYAWVSASFKSCEIADANEKTKFQQGNVFAAAKALYPLVYPYYIQTKMWADPFVPLVNGSKNSCQRTPLDRRYNCLNQVIPATCFQLECKMSLIPLYNSASSTYLGNGYRGLFITGSSTPLGNNLHAIGGNLIIQNTSVEALCAFESLGNTFQYFNIESSLAPSGVFKCTIRNSLLNAVGSSLAIALTASSFFPYLFALLILFYLVGIPKTYVYVLSGGKVLID